MGRVVEVLVGVSALAGIATFLGVRTAVRRTLRSLGRKPESPSPKEHLQRDQIHHAVEDALDELGYTVNPDTHEIERRT